MVINKKKKKTKWNKFKREAVPRNLWQEVAAGHTWKTRLTGAKEKLYRT